MRKMKALIIGGTNGFGREISDQILDRRSDLITVSRSDSGIDNFPHFSCDIGDLELWYLTLQRIKLESDSLDILAGVVGFARAKHPKDLTIEDFNITIARNVTYITLALQELSDLLQASEDPRVITLGSQWSYRTDCDEFVPYIIAKHTLRAFTKNFAQKNPKIGINHYCVPTMDTPGYREVRKSFQEIGKEPIINGTPKGLAEPKVIARSLVAKALETDASGAMFIIRYDGEIEERI